MRRDNEAELNLTSLFMGLVNKAWIVAGSGILCGLLLFEIVYLTIEKQYEVDVSMYVNNMTHTSNVNNISYSDITASIMITNTYIAIVESDMVLDAVLEETGLEYTRKELSEMMEVDAVNNTEVLQIKITGTDPEETALIAMAFADVATENLTEIVEGSSVKLLSAIEVPSEPTGPSYFKIAVLGFMLGTVVSSIIILIGLIFGLKVLEEKDLEQWNYPILGTIPDLASNTARKGGYYGKKGTDRRNRR